MSLTMKQDKRKVDNKSDRMTKNIAEHILYGRIKEPI